MRIIPIPIPGITRKKFYFHSHFNSGVIPVFQKSITGEGKRNVPAFPGLWHQAGTFPILWSDILNVFIGNWDGRTQFQVEKGKFRWDFGKEFPDSLEFSQAPLERVLTGIIPAHGMGMGWDLRPLNPKPFHNSLFGIFPVFPTKKSPGKKKPSPHFWEQVELSHFPRSAPGQYSINICSGK